MIRHSGLLLLVTSLVIAGIRPHTAIPLPRRSSAPTVTVIRCPMGPSLGLGTVRLRHGSEVNSVIFTPDGKSLIASDSNTIRVYDPVTAAQLRSFPGHPFGYVVLALSPDGKLLAGIGGAASVYLWNLATGRLLREFGQRPQDETGNLVSLVFSPDSKTVVTVGCETGLQFWDTATGKRLRHLAPKDTGWCVAYSPNGKLIAAGGGESLQLWDLTTDKRVWCIKKESPKNGVHAVVFSPDGKMLAVGDKSGSVILVAPADGKVIRRWEAHVAADEPHEGTQAVAFSPDGKTLASGGDDGVIYFWDPLTGKKLRALRGHRKTVYSVAFSRDGRTLASGSLDQTVRLWDVATGRESPAFDGHQDGVWHVAFSPDGKTLASGGDDTVRLWDPERGKQLQVLEDNKAIYSPDGKLLATLGIPDGIRLRDPATGKLIRSLDAPDHFVIAFHPDGRMLASAGGGAVIRLWDATTGKEQLRLTAKRKTERMDVIAFSPGGKLLACVEDLATIQLWDWAAQREVRRLAIGGKERIQCFAFAPDGRSLVGGGSDGTIRFWRLEDGEQRLQWQADERGVEALAFSPDGRFLASVGVYEPAVVVWEVATGKEINRLQGHRGWVRALAFSQDGRRLASGSLDFTILVWDVAAALRKSEKLPTDSERCWKALADADLRVAYRAVWDLANMPAKSVPMLSERLRPVPQVEQARIDRLIADLDAEEFAVRNKATEALEALGELAEPSLRKSPPRQPVGRNETARREIAGEGG